MRFAVSCLALFLAFPVCAQNSYVQSLSHQEMVEFGKRSFARRCSGCHGINADGAGPSANMLDPKPRNLIEGSFKLRSTPSGVLPTTQDLIRTIHEGIPNSAMPPFRMVNQKEKLALALYIRSLRPEFAETEQDQIPLPVPPKPREIFSSKSGLLAAARSGYKEYKQSCLLCHGPHGKGDGPSAATLVDNDERPIKPADLSYPKLKSGRSAADAFKAISTGLDGSPMAGFHQSLNEKQRWELVAFIFYLRGLEKGIYTDADNFLEPISETSNEENTDDQSEE